LSRTGIELSGNRVEVGVTDDEDLFVLGKHKKTLILTPRQFLDATLNRT
jgi:hypothetical protein